jgi:hypothetical protein
MFARAHAVAVRPLSVRRLSQARRCFASKHMDAPYIGHMVPVAGAIVVPTCCS